MDQLSTSKYLISQKSYVVLLVCSPQGTPCFPVGDHTVDGDDHASYACNYRVFWIKGGERCAFFVKLMNEIENIVVDSLAKALDCYVGV